MKLIVQCYPAFSDSVMAGMKAEVFIMNNAGSVFSNFMSARFEANILGNKFSPLEVIIHVHH